MWNGDTCPITEILSRTTAHKISLKSENRVLGYAKNRFLNLGPSVILNFKDFHIWSSDCH